MNTNSVEPITLEDSTLEVVEIFTYLGSVMNKQGGTEAVVKTRTGKARAEHKNICRSREIKQQPKIMIFNTNVKSMLLYGAETRRTTKNAINKVQTFIKNCSRKILNIHWPEKISNNELWTRIQQIQAIGESGR